MQIITRRLHQIRFLKINSMDFNLSLLFVDKHLTSGGPSHTDNLSYCCYYSDIHILIICRITFNINDSTHSIYT